ncbi:Metallo-dependent phosphatase [Colletotrichum zoysiae]|uniref:Metallo-dependent phosphatase n=1 Tax=Colletotrichum zoysiae TaxID=1216348 RepID=A0AAD9H5X0_9PEZI|nr:Metallo-dependent phosphatase [Colletotrichum zoysiae]
MDVVRHQVVTDLTVLISSTTPPSSCESGPRKWHRIEKDLYIHKSQQSAWLYVELAPEAELKPEDLLVIDIRVGDPPPKSSSWESRLGGIWVLRSTFSCRNDKSVTEVDVLFGMDAVDPRPQWALTSLSLQLDGQPTGLAPRLSVLRDRVMPKPDDRPTLRVREGGTFKIVQISDTHMVTGVGECNDAIGAHGEYLRTSEADPLTVNFIGEILDVEKPDLVVLTGDQVHHDIPDTQSALFKVVAPIIKRSIPFAAVFGNHDSEGTHALSREEQMSILQNLPFSLCEPGPEHVDGIGNFCLQVLAPEPSQTPVADLYFLDSHGEISSEIRKPDYDPIKQSQIDWFTDISHAQRLAREKDNSDNAFHLSLVFQHIPLPEFGDPRLSIHNGHRGEPSESPSCNTHFYDALAKAGVSALGCGHDHVNDFCALLSQQTPQNDGKPPQSGPWLCYGGGSGFGGYCSYGEKRYYRGARVWELGPSDGSLVTWRRVEYGAGRVDELVLVGSGVVVNP